MGATPGAVRGLICRARAALRDGAGMLIPMPALRALLDAGPMQAESAGLGIGGAAAGLTAGGGGASRSRPARRCSRRAWRSVRASPYTPGTTGPTRPGDDRGTPPHASPGRAAGAGTSRDGPEFDGRAAEGGSSRGPGAGESSGPGSGHGSSASSSGPGSVRALPAATATADAAMAPWVAMRQAGTGATADSMATITTEARPAGHGGSGELGKRNEYEGGATRAAAGQDRAAAGISGHGAAAGRDRAAAGRDRAAAVSGTERQRCMARAATGASTSASEPPPELDCR